MSLLGFCQWLSETPGSVALHESLYIYPLVESVHVLTLCVFLGMAATLDLRLIGLTLRRVPVGEVADRLFPFMLVGFVIMTISGVALFYAIPVRSYQSVWFRIKVIMLILAGLNAWRYHVTIHKSVAIWGQGAVTPKRARVAGMSSLTLWALVVILGRLMAYNWFDCDRQPQPAVINWAAGCVE
jgi:hypothetical protein